MTRDYTWNLHASSVSKLSRYRLCDNYLRFYLRYIEPNTLNILKDRDALPRGIASIMGLQFENLVLNNTKRIQKILSISPEDIVVDNPYFQKATQKKAGVQIDYMILTRFHTLYICEIKFHQEALDLSVIKEVKQKMQAMQLPKGHSLRPVLIHVIDFSRFLEES